MIRWLAIAVVLASCKPDPEVVRADLLATNSNVVVRAELPGRSLADLEQLVAIPLEKALAGIANVEAIDTTIENGRVEILLTATDSSDARVIERAIRLRLVSAALPFMRPPTTVLQPTAWSVVRFLSNEDPGALDHLPGGVFLVRTCGPEPGLEVVVDPAKTIQMKVALDDVIDAIDAHPESLGEVMVGTVRLDAIASMREIDRSDCRAIGAKHLASVHYPGKAPELYQAVLSAGWKFTDMLGGQAEFVFGFDGSSTGLVERVVETMEAQPGIDGAVAMEELGPPHVGRVIFHPKWDADVRKAIQAAVAAVPGVRLLEVVEGSGQRAEAFVTGPDRQAVIARARAALIEIANADPEGGAGCVGCDLRSGIELQLGEATSSMRRIAELVRDGIEVGAAARVRVRLDSGLEMSPESIAQLPVRAGRDRTAPLSSLATLVIAERPAMLLRHDGKPAVIVWKRPWNTTIYGAKETLEKAFPGASVRDTYSKLW